MIKITEWILPIKTVSEANKHEHWSASSKRHKAQKTRIKWQFKIESAKISIPCIIKLTRISPRILDDDDNLPMAFKWIKDAIADNLIPGLAVGRADSDPRLKFQFAQEKGKPKEYAIKVEFFNSVN